MLLSQEGQDKVTSLRSRRIPPSRIMAVRSGTKEELFGRPEEDVRPEEEPKMPAVENIGVWTQEDVDAYSDLDKAFPWLGPDWREGGLEILMGITVIVIFAVVFYTDYF